MSHFFNKKKSFAEKTAEKLHIAEFIPGKHKKKTTFYSVFVKSLIYFAIFLAGYMVSQIQLLLS
jgi:hypothetical protein